MNGFVAARSQNIYIQSVAMRSQNINLDSIALYLNSAPSRNLLHKQQLVQNSARS